MTKKLFWIGLMGVFLVSVALRFWGLGRFNTLVFDEIYYAKFGNNYLINQPFFNAHPPLSQYLMAIGIWIGKRFPFGQEEVNSLAGSVLSPITYRWLNALCGSFIPLLVGAIAYQISHRRSFSFFAALFTAADGLFLVESRYALNNIYIVIFGLLGQLFILLALQTHKQKRFLNLVFSGLAFGAAISTKWNGLWFLLGIYLMWTLAWGFNLIQNKLRGAKFNYRQNINTKDKLTQISLQSFTKINLLELIFYLGLIPVIVYCLVWIPHLQLDTRFNFIEVHKRILQFHENLGGNNSKIHPYCSPWYSWILMIRPMAYFYETTRRIGEAPPVVGPPLPKGTAKVIYDVHAMGNPFLWWFALAAILFLIVFLGLFIINNLAKKQLFASITRFSSEAWIGFYIVINYAINLLPWARVNRCVFIYHYMTAVVFGFMAIAWLVDQCLRSYNKYLRACGITITVMILAAFVFWMPIYLGLPLSPQGYRLRMWFQSWV